MRKTLKLILKPSQMDYLLTHLPVGYSIKAKAEDLDYIIFAAEQERNVKAIKKP